jgi:very-short-patch-repair endonuclease/DNA-directed RNA polymerase subunit RPC12/RpoP
MSNKKIPFERSFASCKNAELWSSKNGITPDKVAIKSSKEAIFNCRNCTHEFKSLISGMSSDGNGCPYCASRVLCNNLDCNECFEKSFASHPNVIYWSELNIEKENKLINPRFIFKNSHVPYLFDCHKCFHTFEKPLDSFKNTNGCPYCSSDKLCLNESCKECFNKSFASHEKAIYWSSKNELSNRKVFKNDNKKYFFDCVSCNHTFSICLNNVVEGKWCHYCSHHKLCENKDCQFCFDNSFSSHPKSEFWSEKNKLNPRQVFITSHTKYLFNCNICKKEFECSLANIYNGRWCPTCKNITEKILFNELKKIYINLEHQLYVTWCRNFITNRFLPFDFVLHDYKIIIELDGKQHFVQVMNWDSPEDQFTRDIYKMRCANQNGYSVIRIYQKDVYSDKIDWLNIIQKSIEEIKTKNIIENHYISFDENLYKKYIEELHN